MKRRLSVVALLIGSAAALLPTAALAQDGRRDYRERDRYYEGGDRYRDHEWRERRERERREQEFRERERRERFYRNEYRHDGYYNEYGERRPY